MPPATASMASVRALGAYVTAIVPGTYCCAYDLGGNARASLSVPVAEPPVLAVDELLVGHVTLCDAGPGAAVGVTLATGGVPPPPPPPPHAASTNAATLSKDMNV